jgi:hypothetical protein
VVIHYPLSNPGLLLAHVRAYCRNHATWFMAGDYRLTATA